MSEPQVARLHGCTVAVDVAKCETSQCKTIKLSGPIYVYGWILWLYPSPKPSGCMGPCTYIPRVRTAHPWRPWAALKLSPLFYSFPSNGAATAPLNYRNISILSAISAVTTTIEAMDLQNFAQCLSYIRVQLRGHGARIWCKSGGIAWRLKSIPSPWVTYSNLP